MPSISQSQTHRAPTPEGVAIEQQRRAAERENAQRAAQEKTPDVRLTSELQKQTALLPDNEQPCFLIQTVVIEATGQALPTGVLDALHKTASLQGMDTPLQRCLGQQGVQILIDRLQHELIAQGYSTSSVMAAPQNLQTGQLILKVFTGIHAGDGGFDIDVQGTTTLTGAQITSTDKAVQGGKNKFNSAGGIDIQDLQNSAQYDASSYSVSASVTGDSRNQDGTPKLDAAGKPIQGKPQGSVGYGSDSGNASSTSTSGISGIAGDTSVLTGDKETGLTPLFDAAKVKYEVQAQVAITAEFGKNASKAWGDFATNQENELRNLGKNEEADKWREGGTYRAAGHFAIGGLGGGSAGALASGGISLAADTLNSLQDELKDKLIGLGLSPDAAQMLSQGAGMASAGVVGTAVGGTVGGASAFNTDTSNRQLHPTEKQIIRNELAKKMAKDKGISEAQAVARLEAQLLRQVDATAASTGSSDPEAALYINSYKAAHQGQSVGTDQWGNSVPLFGAVGYQRQDSTIFSANPQTTKPPANVGFSQVGDYLGGMAKGVLQGVKDTVNALMHPIDTVNNLVDAASDLTGTGQKIQQKAGDAINAAQDGNTGPAGELVGEQMGAGAAGNAIGAGVGKVVTMVKAAIKNGTTGGKTTPSDVNGNPSASQDVAHNTPNAEPAAAPTKLPSATDATGTSPYSSSGTSYVKTTTTDANGQPIATQPNVPSAGANGGVGGNGASGAIDDVAPVTSGGTANGGNAGAGTTVITPEMETKILFGERVTNASGAPTNRMIGAHAGEISNSNPNYAVEVLSVNADGTRNVKLVTQFNDGNLSKIKSSTLFPENWTSNQTMNAVKQVGDLPPVATRADGAALYQSTVNGVQIEVIKVGSTVTAGYPVGSRGFQTITYFLTGKN